MTTVAMESTGVYWIPVFQILEARGFEVVLVNARLVRSAPGRKSDVADCEWLRHLHSVGLLRGFFRPPDEVCALRTLLRHRDTLVGGERRLIRARQRGQPHPPPVKRGFSARAPLAARRAVQSLAVLRLRRLDTFQLPAVVAQATARPVPRPSCPPPTRDLNRPETPLSHSTTAPATSLTRAPVAFLSQSCQRGRGGVVAALIALARSSQSIGP